MQNNKKEKLIELGIRYWIVGAVYFFIGWGLDSVDIIDQFFLLVFAYTLVNILIVNPVINSMLNLEEDPRKYNEIPLRELIFKRFKVFLKVVVIVLLVIISYIIINMMFIAVFELNENTIVLAAEPFGFALLYIGYYYLLRKLSMLIKKSRRK